MERQQQRQQQRQGQGLRQRGGDTWPGSRQQPCCPLLSTLEFAPETADHKPQTLPPTDGAEAEGPALEPALPLPEPPICIHNVLLWANIYITFRKISEKLSKS